MCVCVSLGRSFVRSFVRARNDISVWFFLRVLGPRWLFASVCQCISAYCTHLGLKNESAVLYASAAESQSRAECRSRVTLQLVGDG